MSRREFPRDVYAQIVRRAKNQAEQVCCEGCGLVLGKKPYHVDHTIPDALFLEKARKLTAADGKLLGVECCHKPKTRADQGDIARAKRREAKDGGFKRFGNPIPGSKASPYRKRMNGNVEFRSRPIPQETDRAEG